MEIDRIVGLNKTFHVEFLESTKERVVAQMPIVPEVFQPFGFLHGGATIALLESAASAGAENNTDFEKERPFGIDVHVRHWKSGKAGMLKGVAELESTERGKQFWKVTAYDDGGDVVSDGAIITKIVSLERLAEKEREREETRQKGE
ncbi:MAG: PaaI family thioesterase [Raoultibacter sp.]